MRFELFVVSWSLVAGLGAFYVVWGAVSDAVVARRRGRRARVLDLLSVLLFEPDEEAERVYEDVRRLPRRTLLRVIQSLAVDLSGQARLRLQQLVRASGLERSIRRRATSKRWRVRVQAAQLQYLVTHPDFDRHRLLTDRHPLVRARAAESLTRDQATDLLPELLDLLRDRSAAVRLAAQHAILSTGAEAVWVLLDRIEVEGPELLELLELAANLPDPRLLDGLDRQARSADPQAREMAARALSQGTGVGAVDILERLLDDEQPTVRAAAIDGLAKVESLRSAAAIGRRLADRSWTVRRAAGLALDRLGAPGRLILRKHLDDADPYARDMARQVLDAFAARSGVALVPPIDDALAPFELMGASS